MSPAINGSSAIQSFKHSNAIEMCNRIAFDFYTGLPHVVIEFWHGFYNHLSLNRKLGIPNDSVM